MTQPAAAPGHEQRQLLIAAAPALAAPPSGDITGTLTMIQLQQEDASQVQTAQVQTAAFDPISYNDHVGFKIDVSGKTLCTRKASYRTRNRPIEKYCQSTLTTRWL